MLQIKNLVNIDAIKNCLTDKEAQELKGALIGSALIAQRSGEFNLVALKLVVPHFKKLLKAVDESRVIPAVNIGADLLPVYAKTIPSSFYNVVGSVVQLINMDENGALKISGIIKALNDEQKARLSQSKYAKYGSEPIKPLNEFFPETKQERSNMVTKMTNSIIKNVNKDSEDEYVDRNLQKLARLPQALRGVLQQAIADNYASPEEAYRETYKALKSMPREELVTRLDYFLAKAPKQDFISSYRNMMDNATPEQLSESVGNFFKKYDGEDIRELVSSTRSIAQALLNRIEGKEFDEKEYGELQSRFITAAHNIVDKAIDSLCEAGIYFEPSPLAKTEKLFNRAITADISKLKM